METCVVLHSTSSSATLPALIPLNEAKCENHEFIPSLGEESDPLKKTDMLTQDAVCKVQMRSCEILPEQLQLQGVIGEGKFGLVYKGVWNGNPCAIKKLKNGITKPSVQYQRLLIELAVLSGVGSHPNIIEFFGACIQDLESPLIVEELVEGTDLEAYLRSRSIGFNLGRRKVRHLPQNNRYVTNSVLNICEQVLSWSLDILQALEHLHGLTPMVMHRDLKPANILVTRDRHTLKLTDFGLAKSFESSSPLPSNKPHPLQRQHTCEIGTPRYMAPEVLEHYMVGDIDTHHAIYTEKADIYSAALILWYMLTGWEPPCHARNNPRGRPDAGSARHRWAAMAGLVERMWDHDPEARPAAAECVEALRAMAPDAAGCTGADGCLVQ